MLQKEIFKFKLINLPNLYRDLDRLTRVKNPEEKFNKVFDSIIVEYLIEPKYTLKQLELFEFSKKNAIVKTIWNKSVEEICRQNNVPICNTGFVNKVLEMENHQMFATSTYFDEDFDFDSLIKIPCPLDPVPLNVLRLLNLQQEVSSTKLREEKSLKFPIEKIVLAEGITEEILLPVFARSLGYDFDKNGIHLISAGGKNKVARWYVQNKDIFKLPIFILLDQDAVETKQTLDAILLPKDKIYIIKRGEFEDIIPQKLIKKTINDAFKNDFSISIAELRTNDSMCKVLKQIFHDHNIGDFKKAEFAKLVANEVEKLVCTSEEINMIISNLKEL